MRWKHILWIVRSLLKTRSEECVLLERFQLLRQISDVLLPEYRFKWPQMSWWSDNGFNQYLAKFEELTGNNTDRRWNVWQLLRFIASVDGDTAEVGVYRGATSWLICAASAVSKLGCSGRIHHVFDSFAGLSEPSEHDGDHWYKGALACGEEEAGRNLIDVSQYVAVRFSKDGSLTDSAR